jgi:hypothetical protein
VTARRIIAGLGHNRHVQRFLRWLPGVLIAGAVAALYRRAVGFELAGDDFLLVQLSNAALHRWSLLFAPLDSFYRPTTTWTLLLDRALWGHAAASYHLGNVLLRALSAILLLALARRLRLSWALSMLVTLLWACTPFTSEPVVVVGARIDELLWLSWLGLSLAWPGERENWNGGRLAAVAACLAWSAFSKETWVVTPAVVLALELGLRRRTVRQAVRPVALASVLVVGYVVAYFLAFPTSKGYFEWSAAPLAKLPHQLAAFLSFEPLRPVQFVLTWRGALATGLVGAMLVVIARRRSPAGILGAALLLAPGVPTILVPFLPARYTSIPYAGFLLVLAATVDHVLRGLRPAPRRVLAGALAGVAGLALAAGLLGVRAELDDAALVSTANRKLLDESARIADEFPVNRPVALVRLERDNPLAQIAQTVRGLPKLYYVRHDDPYGLTESASLLEWVLRRRDLRVRRYDDGDSRFVAAPGAVLAHESGRFVWLERDAPALGAAARAWRQQVVHVRVVMAERWR